MHAKIFLIFKSISKLIAQKWTGEIPSISYLLSATYYSENCVWSNILFFLEVVPKFKDIFLTQPRFLIPILQALIGQQFTPGVNAEADIFVPAETKLWSKALLIGPHGNICLKLLFEQEFKGIGLCWRSPVPRRTDYSFTDKRTSNSASLIPSHCFCAKHWTLAAGAYLKGSCVLKAPLLLLGQCRSQDGCYDPRSEWTWRRDYKRKTFHPGCLYCISVSKRSHLARAECHLGDNILHISVRGLVWDFLQIL